MRREGVELEEGASDPPSHVAGSNLWKQPKHLSTMQHDINQPKYFLCCAEEGVELEEGAFDMLSRVANGDLRKAITTLQSAVRLKGLSVRADTLLDVAGQVGRQFRILSWSLRAIKRVMFSCETRFAG